MQPIIDLWLVYEFTKRLATPFNQTEAFKRGIIDADGNVMRPKKTLKTQADHRAWTWFDVLVNNLKRTLIRSGGTGQLAAIATAYYLMKEPPAKLKALSGLSEDALPVAEITTTYLSEAKQFDEDAPVNAAGTGNVAGLGVGPQGEPGRRMKPKKIFGAAVFEVSSDVFNRCRLGKRKGEHYRRYVGEDATGQAIREYGRANYNEAIILRDTATEAMLYLRYPKA